METVGHLLLPLRLSEKLSSGYAVTSQIQGFFIMEIVGEFWNAVICMYIRWVFFPECATSADVTFLNTFSK